MPPRFDVHDQLQLLPENERYSCPHGPILLEEHEQTGNASTYSFAERTNIRLDRLHITSSGLSAPGQRQPAQQLPSARL